MKNPGAVDMPKAMREPLRFQQVETVVGKIKRLSSPKKMVVDFLSKQKKIVNSL